MRRADRTDDRTNKKISLFYKANSCNERSGFDLCNLNILSARGEGLFVDPVQHKDKLLTQFDTGTDLCKLGISIRADSLKTFAVPLLVNYDYVRQNVNRLS